MLYFITPLIYNFTCDWYENWDRKLAAYQLNKERYLIQKYAVKLK